VHFCIDGSRLVSDGGPRVFTLRGDRLVLMTRVWQALGAVRISHDGRWVVPVRPLKKQLRVFSTATMRKPAYTIPAPDTIWNTCFDGAGNVYMWHGQKGGLAVFGPERQLIVNHKKPPYHIAQFLGRPLHTGVAVAGPKVWYFQPPDEQAEQPDREPNE
jgi:hypothetical protein